MKRKEWTFAWVLVAVLVSLLVVPLALPVAGDEPPVEPLIAGEDDDDDIELHPGPTKIYDEHGKELLYPWKELIANDPDDYDYRIGTAPVVSSWTTFKDHPGDGYHDVPDLTIENIEYNFPMLSTSHQVVNSRLNLGYFPPESTQQVGKIAETFRPAHDRITRIDILVARHRGRQWIPSRTRLLLSDRNNGRRQTG